MVVLIRFLCAFVVVVALLERRSQPCQGDAIAGRAGGAATRQRQQQVVVVGDHGDRARRAPASTSGSSTAAVGVDQLDDVVQVGQPLALAAVQHEALDPLALAQRPRRVRRGVRPSSVATASGSSRSGSGVTDSQDARLTMADKVQLITKSG